MSAPDPHPQTSAQARAAQLLRPGEGCGLWYAFYTRPRKEKRAAESCRDLEIRHYLPLRQSAPRGSGRKGQRRYYFDVPLFPGYIFACCTPEERYEFMCSGHLVRTIEVVDQGQLLDELYNIYLATHSSTALRLYPQLKRGRRVRIVRGPLAGVCGRISARKEEFRLVLNLSILGTAVAATIDMADVELL